MSFGLATPRRPVLLLATALLCATALSSTSCQNPAQQPEARAYQVTDRSQLIGGPEALGDIGDYVLENDEIRVLIQNIGTNRGIGIFGGSLMDADLVRHDAEPDPFGGGGKATIGEVFPTFFLEIIDPYSVDTVDPGTLGDPSVSDGAAVVEVRGDGGELVSMLRIVNHAMVNAYDFREQIFDNVLDGKYPRSDGEPTVEFTARYILEPGARSVRMDAEMRNVSGETLRFPNELVSQLGDILTAAFEIDIDVDDFHVPTGAAVGAGAFNDFFLPGIGYNVQFGLEEALLESDVDLPAIPTPVIDVLATSSTAGVSYGFAAGVDPEPNYVHSRPQYYGDDTNPHDMLFLFEAYGYGGVATHAIPDQLEPNEAFTATSHFIVGSGDVAHIRDEAYRLHDIDTHTVSGRMYDDHTGEPVGEHAELLLYDRQKGGCSEDDDPYLFSHAYTNPEGYFEFQLPPGDYCYRTRDEGDTGDFNRFSVDGPTSFQTTAPPSGKVEAFIVDQTGNPIPARMTLVGEYDPLPGLDPWEYLFDLSSGERWLTSESAEYDESDTDTRRYIEMIEFSSADGRASTRVRPGVYTAVFSRGLEYDLVEKDVVVRPGDVSRLSVELTRELNPQGWLNGDFHMHAEGSMDSALDFNDRVVSIAGEGVEVVVSSDHNYVADYMPYIHRNGLERFLRSVVGVELTTLEAGHFNAFPIDQNIAEPNRGYVDWQQAPPSEIFAQIRQMGSLGPNDTILQVNHPRDRQLGYFNQHFVDALTGFAELPVNAVDDDADSTDRAIAAAISPSGPAFAEEYVDEHGETQYRSVFDWSFDAIELYNGKRIHLLHHFRMPWDKDKMPQHVREQLDDEQYEALPDEAGVILCDGDEVAYPGAIDDWYNFLNYPRPDGRYLTYTATGNSDSHHYGGAGDPEPGFPRNYFYVGHDDPQQLTLEELSEALQEHRNVVTNGPFVNVEVDGEGIGSTVVSDDGRVTLELDVRAVDWVVGGDPQDLRLHVVANGERIVENMVVDLGGDGRWRDEIDIDLDDHDHIHHADDGIRDTWFVVEVEGDNNLFPVVQPAEVPKLEVGEAFGGITEPLGFGGSPTPDELTPAEITDIRPFAFTNPIWVIDGQNGPERSGFRPPEPPKASCVDGDFERGALVEPGELPFGHRRLDAAGVPLEIDEPGIFDREPGELRDVRVLFEHWH